jgi:hypothetical protein
VRAGRAEGDGASRLGRAARGHVDELLRPALAVDDEGHAHAARVLVAVVPQRSAQLDRRVRRGGPLERGDGLDREVRRHGLHAGHVLDHDLDSELLQLVEHFVEPLARALVRAAQVGALLQVRQEPQVDRRGRARGVGAREFGDLVQRGREVELLVLGARQSVEHAARLFGGRPRQEPRGPGRGQDADAIAARRVRAAHEFARALQGRLEGRAPARLLAHRGRGVDDDHEVATRLGQARERALLAGEGSRQGQREQEHRHRAEEEQQPLLELHAAPRLAPRRLDEAHGRPRLGAVATAVEQVDGDGHPRGREAREQRRVDEASEQVHRPPPPRRMRAVRADSQAERTTSTPRSVDNCTTSAPRARASRASASSCAATSAR